MALFGTLNDLQDAIRDETERRHNGKFNAAMPRIIASAEQRMYHGADAPLKSAPLRLAVMEVTAALTLAAGEVTLPSDYLEIRHIEWPGSPKTYPTYEAEHDFFRHRQDLTSGSPIRYTVRGAVAANVHTNTLYVSPQVSGALTLHYYAKPAALDQEADTNLVLTTHPMLYFHAGLIEAYSYLRNPDEAQKAFGAYVSLSGGQSQSDARARRGNASVLAPRIRHAVIPR